MSESTSTVHVPPRPSLNALTGLRAIAAGWVVVFHFQAHIFTLLPAAGFLRVLTDAGYSGVDLFFVLSGFIISYSYLERLEHWDSGQVGRFLWLRLARLYPLHLLTLCLFAVLVVPGGALSAHPVDIVASLGSPDFYRQLFLVHGWGLLEGTNPTWNYPAWSISSEWFAYLLFPIAAIGLSRVKHPTVALAGVLGASAMNVAAFNWLQSRGYRADLGLNRVMFEFIAGCCLYLLWRERWAFGAPWRLLTPALAVLALAATVLMNAHGTFAGLAAAPLYCGLIYGLAVEGDALSAALGTRIAVYAGEVSFALYMTHAAIDRFVQAYLTPSDFASSALSIRIVILAAYAAVLAITAVVAYEFAERPAREHLRRLLPRGAEVRVPAPVTLDASELSVGETVK